MADTVQDFVAESRTSLLNPTREGFKCWVKVHTPVPLNMVDYSFEPRNAKLYDNLKDSYWDDYLDTLEYTHNAQKETTLR